MAPSEVTYFWRKKRFLTEIIELISGPQLKAHNLCDKDIFFFHYYLTTSMAN